MSAVHEMPVSEPVDLNMRRASMPTGRRELPEVLNDIKGPSRLLRRGDHAYRAGEPLRSLYFVRSGSVKAYRVCEDGEEQVVGFYGTGEIIGFDAIASQRFLCSAVALDTTSIYALPYEQLMSRCEHSPELAQELLRGMSREVGRLEGMSLMLGKKTADQRIAAFLLSQSANQAQHGYSATTFTLTMSRTDIGRYSGLAVETVCRILSRFQAQGLISTRRNQVMLHDVDRLREVAA